MAQWGGRRGRARIMNDLPDGLGGWSMESAGHGPVRHIYGHGTNHHHARANRTRWSIRHCEMQQAWVADAAAG